MNLEGLLEKHPELRRIYNVLKTFLPPPNKIQVFHLSELEGFGFRVRATVMACALPPDKLFFREIPPDPHTFAHELIHLCKKLQITHEEVYGYNLASVVLFCAEEGIYDVNIFKLFELSEEQVNKVLQRYGFDTIEDYYEVVGVIPYTHELKATSEGLKLVKNPRYSERDVVIAFVTELSAGLPYFEHCRKILRDLIELCK